VVKSESPRGGRRSTFAVSEFPSGGRVRRCKRQSPDGKSDECDKQPPTLVCRVTSRQAGGQRFTMRFIMRSLVRAALREHCWI
jgi:hypothetical protein